MPNVYHIYKQQYKRIEYEWCAKIDYCNCTMYFKRKQTKVPFPTIIKILLLQKVMIFKLWSLQTMNNYEELTSWYYQVPSTIR